MDTLIGIYIVVITLSLAMCGLYIWHNIPHWSSLEEDAIRKQLAQAKQTTAYLEQSLKTAESELAPLKKRDEEITIKRHKRRELDLDRQHE